MDNFLNRNVHTSNYKYGLRKIGKMKWKNDGSRTLSESMYYQEVEKALSDWKENIDTSNSVLIGGAALTFYLKPRPTEDLDLLFMSDEDIPDMVTKFKKSRAHAFKHIETHVEIETITPKEINQTKSFFEKVFNTAIISENIRVASPLAIIALKLGRFSHQDKADISLLYEYCLENNLPTDLSYFELSDELIKRYLDLIKNINENMNIDNNSYLLEANYMLDLNVEYISIDSGLPFDIYIFNEKHGEPRIHVGSNIKKRIKQYKDFQFSISLSDTFTDNKRLKVLESSTYYNSFNSFREEENLLIEWLLKGDNNNLNILREKWIKLNKRNFKY